MHLVKTLILVLLVLKPVAGWCANLHYALDARINNEEKKITGRAYLKANADKKMDFSIRNLRNVKVDGNAVTTAADKNISLTLQKGKETIISYEALFADAVTNFIDKDHVFLTSGWYPQPDILVEYALSVTLQKDFMAVSEAEAVKIQEHGGTKTFNFQFKHPLDTLHLSASTRYILKKDSYNDIAVEVYFFKDDAQVADTYIAHIKRYLNMYETMLTPYPYQRFAIVESILPTGNSMPTYALLGREVVHLPFIVKTSLGHEILH